MIRLDYKAGVALKGKGHFLPLLQIVSKYPFPKPIHCARLNDKVKNWRETKMTSFTSEKFLKYVDESHLYPNRNLTWIDADSENQLHLCVNQESEGSVFALSNVQPFLTSHQIKSLFRELLQCHATCLTATCGKDISQVYSRHFTYEERAYHKRMLTWLQYFGKDALEGHGGYECFESNPYVQTERIHDGLLIQIGDNPNVFDTSEGEILLVNAINTLHLLSIKP